MEAAIHDARRMAHAVIISSADPEAGLRRARALAAAAVCSQGGAEACGRCRDCRKAAADIHPDVITVRRQAEDGNVKKEITVDQVRRMAADAAVRPNEARRKVYIIQEAEAMNVPAQNAALKLLEESPAGAMFLLCTDNPGKLLPTVRSRCAELTLNAAPAQEGEESRRLAEEFLRAVAKGDEAALFAWCAKNENLDGASAADFLNAVSALTAELLSGRAPALGLGPAELLPLNDLLARCLRYLRVNVSVKHIFGLLAVDSVPRRGPQERVKG